MKDDIKRIIGSLLLVALPIAGCAQGTLRREIPTTSAYWRAMLKAESGAVALVFTGSNITTVIIGTNFNYSLLTNLTIWSQSALLPSLVVRGTNGLQIQDDTGAPQAYLSGNGTFIMNDLVDIALTHNQYTKADNTGKIVSTTDGGAWTNLFSNFSTNVIPASGVLTIGSLAYTTNLTSDATMPVPLIPASAYFGLSALMLTNGDSSPHSMTLTGVSGPLGVTPAVVWCTNAHTSLTIVWHFGMLYTNAYTFYF
jgi:hypothetical protein